MRYDQTRRSSAHAAQRTPHVLLLGTSTFALCIAGLPFLSVGKLILSDVYSASTLSADHLAAAVAGYPALVGAQRYARLD